MTPGARAGLVAAAVLAADQATKAIVRATIERGDAVEVGLGIQLVNGRNTGIAFGFLQDAGAILVVFAVVALGLLIAFFARHRDRPLIWLPTGMLIGGAAGNVVDRIAEGAVTDFIDLPAWPAFNVADMGITLGVLALLYVLEGPPSRARR